ncbi:MAG TPA: GNAT family N-acetyltransferase [Stellaceae bacterium]|jgi:GNAT superfamily N-acetyltransferase|nr:GNAT family N-acetyltransferase [Stellaceae bacterium]
MPETALRWRIEENCFNAFPALKQVLLDGWLIRFAEGLSRRANSANALRPDCAPVEQVIEAVEGLYRRQRQPPIFRVPSFLEGGMEDALAARGYTGEGDTTVLYGPMAELAARADPEVELSPHAGSDWLAAMGTLQGHKTEQRVTYRRIVRALAVPAAFAALRLDGRIAALAYGAVSNGLLCYESVVTDPRRRRQGLARRIVAALADWARQQGADGACLQVVADNAPAIALYDAFGLKADLYGYRYWRAPAAD